MVGSTTLFYEGVCSVLPKGERNQNRTGEVERPMTVILPEIVWLKTKKRCADCGRGTHLRWRSHWKITATKHLRYWICRACAQKRGGIYRRALKQWKQT